jgi:hypothetical protein
MTQRNNPKRRTSIIWLLSKEQLQDLFNKHSSKADILRELNLSVKKTCNNILDNAALEHSINMSQFEFNRKFNRKLYVNKDRFDNESVFVEDSSYNNGSLLKKRLLEMGWEYKCSFCNIKDYNNLPLVLQLDHINGVSNDNRLENLRFLCPNCHSQTETFASRGRGYRKNVVCECGEKKVKSARLCLSCFRELKEKLKEKDKEEIQKLLWIMPLAQIAKKFGIVSGATVILFAKKNNLSIPPLSYNFNQINSSRKD